MCLCDENINCPEHFVSKQQILTILDAFFGKDEDLKACDAKPHHAPGELWPLQDGCPNWVGCEDGFYDYCGCMQKFYEKEKLKRLLTNG